MELRSLTYLFIATKCKNVEFYFRVCSPYEPQQVDAYWLVLLLLVFRKRKHTELQSVPLFLFVAFGEQ